MEENIRTDVYLHINVTFTFSPEDILNFQGLKY